MLRSALPGLRQRITKTAVDALRAPGWLWDTDLRGFAVRARGATRTYVLRYPAPGRPGASRWVTIGQHGRPWRLDPADRTPGGRGRVLTAELARAEALRLLGVVAGGGDPAASRAAAGGVPALEDFAARYLREHVEARRAPATARSYREALALATAELGKGRLDRVSHHQVVRLHGGLRRTPFLANRVLSVLSSCFGAAVRWGVLPGTHANPCRGVERYPEPRRERYLTADELRRLGAGLESAPVSAYARVALQVLMLTGARPDEVVRLRRDQVLARTRQKGKTGVRSLYFNTHALELMRALPEVRGNPYVFPGSAGLGRRSASHLHATSLSRIFRAVAKAAKVDCRLYDLRHTVASIALQRGKSLSEIGAMLGHKRYETTRRYAHLADEQVRAASDEVAEEIAKAISGTTR